MQAFDNMIQGPFVKDVGEAIKGSRLPYTFALTASIWGGLHMVVKMFDPLDRLSKHRRILCFMHEVFFEFPLNIGLLTQAVHWCHLDRDGRSGLCEPSHSFWQVVKLITLSCTNTVLLTFYSQACDYVLRDINLVWAVMLLLVEGLGVFWLYRDRTSKEYMPDDTSRSPWLHFYGCAYGTLPPRFTVTTRNTLSTHAAEQLQS
jgi:hypothetical protein